MTIKIFKNLGYSIRAIAANLNCSPSTVMYELRRGTGERNGNRGRHPEYSAKRGQDNDSRNRTRCHKPSKVCADNPFIVWAIQKVRTQKRSIEFHAKEAGVDLGFEIEYGAVYANYPEEYPEVSES